MSETPRKVFDMTTLRQHMKDLNDGKVPLREAYQATDDVLDTALAIVRKRTEAMKSHVKSVIPPVLEAKKG